MSVLSPKNISGEIIPDDYADDDLEPADLAVETQKTGRAVKAEHLSDYGLKLTADTTYGDNELASAAYTEGKRLFAALPKDERKHTSAAFLAAVEYQRMAAAKQLRQSKERRMTGSQPTTKKIVRRVVKTTPQQASDKTTQASAPKLVRTVVRRAVKASQPAATPAAPKKSRLIRQIIAEAPEAAFDCLGIDELGPEPMVTEVTAILRWTSHGNLVERIIEAHWAMVKGSERGQTTELDLVIDTRDTACELPEHIPFADAASMEIEVIVGEDTLSFEAVRGAFRTQFGVFLLLKFLATRD